MISHYIYWFITLITSGFTIIVIWKFMIGNRDRGGYLAEWKARDARHQSEQSEMDHVQRAEHLETTHSLDAIRDSEDAMKEPRRTSQATVLHLAVKVEEMERTLEDIKGRVFKQ